MAESSPLAWIVDLALGLEYAVRPNDLATPTIITTKVLRSYFCKSESGRKVHKSFSHKILYHYGTCKLVQPLPCMSLGLGGVKGMKHQSLSDYLFQLLECIPQP